MSNIASIKSGPELRPGSVVVIRSGGPLMTVRSINGELIQCRWFDSELTACCADFHVSELKVER